MSEENKKFLGLKLNVWPVIVIAILITSNIFFVIKYISVKGEVGQLKITQVEQKESNKVLGFTKLFVEKVLRSEQEVDFETRLKLENTIRETGDKEILAEWQKFIQSTTEEEARDGVKNLLGVLLDKI